MSASWSMARKLTASFSYRVATRRHSFSQPISRSTTLRRRYCSRSNDASARSPSLALWSSGRAITAPILRRPSQRRMRRLLYALSAASRRGLPLRRPPGRRTLTVAMTASKTTDSCRCPGVTSTPSPWPAPSQTRCTLVPYPPCDRPRAWSAGSPGLPWGGFSPGPGGGPVGADDGAVDAEEVPVDAAAGLGPGLEVVEDPAPQAALAPAVEAGVDGLPGAEKLRQVAPGRAGAEDPEDAVDHEPVVLRRPSRPLSGLEQGPQDLPLRVGQAVSRSLHVS